MTNIIEVLGSKAYLSEDMEGKRYWENDIWYCDPDFIRYKNNGKTEIMPVVYNKDTDEIILQSDPGDPMPDNVCQSLIDFYQNKKDYKIICQTELQKSDFIYPSILMKYRGGSGYGYTFYSMD